MKSYKRYLEKMGDFKMRAIDPFQDIFIKGNFRFGDIEELDSLQGLVLKELADTLPGNVKLKLKKLREINKGFMEFDNNYAKLYAKSEKDLLHKSDLSKYFPFEILDNPEMAISTDYLKIFYQSILDRQKLLLNSIEKIEDILVSHKETSI